MNSIQRVLAAATFGKGQYGCPDRVPVFPVPLMQGALVYQCSVKDYYAMSADRIANAQVEINRMFDGIPDGVAGFPNVIQDVSAFGVSMQYHYENSTPALDRMLIQDYDEILQLRCPNPESASLLCKTRDTITALKEKIGEEKVVLGACIAPFSLPSMLMGTAAWMRLLFTPSLRDTYFDRIMDVCQRFVIEWANLQFRAGAHIVVLADGMASATLLPRGMFTDYAFPVIQQTIRELDGMIGYEAVGRAEPFVDLLADSGAVALLIGEEDNLTICKKKAMSKVALIGNINNMKMRRWSRARVELQSKLAISEAKDGYGFILANQGPEIPFDVPIENIDALIRSVEKYGRYDKSVSGAAA